MTRTTDFQPGLTEEQVAFFRENGFLSIERITTDEEVDSVVARLASLPAPG